MCDLVFDFYDVCLGFLYLMVLSWGFCCLGDLVYCLYCV